MLEAIYPPKVAARMLALVLLGGKGSGNFDHAGRPGLVGGSGLSRPSANALPDKALLLRPGLRFDIAKIGTRRFLYNPKTGEIVLGLEQRSSGDHEGAHGIAFEDAMKGRGNHRMPLHQTALYDEFSVRGVLGSLLTGETGIWLSEAPEDEVDRTDIIFKFLDAMRENGVDENTVITHPMWMSPSRQITMARVIGQRMLGGPGSGNFDHAGRPGLVGGSGPSYPTELTKVSGAMGSNPGGVFRDNDGQKWYVKHYKNPEQALGEHLSNSIYAAAGINAPISVLGKSGEYASKWLENIKGTVQSEGLSQEIADQILDGFAADVFLSNWDTVGLTRDNVAVHNDGSVTRIDQGGTLLHRAQGALKPQETLNSLSEWAFFSSGNKEYRDVFKAAGIKDGDALGQRAIEQIEKIVAIRPSNGWAEFVNQRVPSASDAWKSKVGTVLETRHKLLLKKRDELQRRSLGGPGSGYFDHAGRPGKRGGSKKGKSPEGVFELGAVGYEGSVTSHPLDADEIDTTEHFAFGIEMERGPEQRFRFVEGEIRWNEEPSAEDYFKVDDHYAIYKGVTHLVFHGNRLRPLDTKKFRGLGGPGSGHFDHAGRPGFIGGSAESDATEVASQNERASLQTDSLASPTFVLGLSGRLHGDAQRYVAAYGQRWTSSKLPDDVKRGPAKECYKNASLLVLYREDLDFVEGFAKSAATGDIAFAHAWAVDKLGNVVDPTWDQPENGQYFGVKYDRATYIKHMISSKFYGVLGGDAVAARRVIRTGGKQLRALGGVGSGHWAHQGGEGGEGNPGGSNSEDIVVVKKAKAPPATKEQIETAVAMKAKGSSYAAIEKETGLNPKQAATIIFKHKKVQAAMLGMIATPQGLTYPEPTFPPAHLPESPPVYPLTDLAKQGYEWKEKTSGPNKGKYAFFQNGIQVSKFADKADWAIAAPTIHFGKGAGYVAPVPQPEPGKIGDLMADIEGKHDPETFTPWPIDDSIVRLQGSTSYEQVRAIGVKWADQLFEVEKSAVRAYTGTGSGTVNYKLRHGGELTLNAKRIDSALAKAPSPPPPELVWRSVGISSAGLVASLNTGDVIKLKGFQSSSVDPSRALNGSTSFEIKPKRGGYVASISHHPGEREFLLPHGMQYLVRGITKVPIGMGKTMRLVIQLEML